MGNPITYLVILPILCSPFFWHHTAHFTAVKLQNKSMTPLRQCVACGFGDIERNFAVIDFKQI